MPTVPTQIAPSNVPIYPHVMPAIADTIALGTHSVVLYNGLILNDRSRPDTYKIEDIDGIGGADIRDSREPRPAQHGEIPHDAFWGGQTITLTGKMEAGSLQQLTRMERDLRAAFGSLVESPMKFNWWDVVDQFYEPLQSNAFWKVLSGSGYTISEGKLLGNARSGEGIIYHSKREYFDVRVVEEIKRLVGVPTWGTGVLAKVTAENSFIQATVQQSGSSQTFSLSLQTPTGLKNLGTTAIVGEAITTAWIELRVVGDTIEAFLYEQNPDILPDPIVLYELSAALSGEEAERFGYGISGYSGLLLQSNEYSVGEFKSEGIYPGDLYLNVRPIADPIIKGTLQTSVDRFKKEFQLAVRASDPHIKVWTPLYATAENGRTFPGPFFTYGENGIVAVNRGTWDAQTIAVFQILEPRENEVSTARIEVRNRTTGEFFALEKVPLSEIKGSYILVDSSKFKVVDQSGDNLFRYFNPISSMITLAPGENQLEVVTQGEKVGVRLYWNHTYK